MNSSIHVGLYTRRRLPEGENNYAPKLDYQFIICLWGDSCVGNLINFSGWFDTEKKRDIALKRELRKFSNGKDKILVSLSKYNISPLEMDTEEFFDSRLEYLQSTLCSKLTIQ